MERVGKTLECFQQPTKHPSSTKRSTKTSTEEEAQEQLRQNAEQGYGPNPYCQLCNGFGYISKDVPFGDPDFGKAFPCPAKSCRKDSFEVYKRGEAYLHTKGISSKYQGFDNFRPVAGTEETLDAFKRLALGEADYFMILCYGGVGNGKTHLCNALTTGLNFRGIDARLYSVGDMISQLKESINTNTTEMFTRQLKQLPALILDDFRVEYGSLWEMGKVEDIIDSRYRDALITVLTTNRDLSELPDRVVSRFYEPELSRVVLNQGKDYRRR